jgi:CheY-like chemotaxis protein
MPEVYLQTISTDDPESDSADVAVAVTHFPWVVGRLAGCDQRVDLPFISRRHCALFLRDDRVWVRDLGSRNGTYLNGEPLTVARPLQDGDRLSLSQLAFQVRLEARPGTPAAGAGAVVEEAKAGGPARHVLVVEDNVDAAETLALLLKGWGHEVRVAHDGPAAIDAAQARQPDAVLLDIRLPGMDGYEVAQQLRTRPGFEKTTLVAMTGYDAEKARRRSEEAGFDHLLTKPVDPDALQELLSHSGVG